MCFDAHAVCSLRQIAPLIKALSSSDPVELFLLSFLPVISHSPPLSSILASLPPCLLPAFHHLASRLTSSLIVFPPSLPACLPCIHTLLSSISPPTLPVVLISGGKSPSPAENQYSVYRIVNQGTQKTDSSLNSATGKQLIESDAVYQQEDTVQVTQN